MHILLQSALAAETDGSMRLFIVGTMDGHDIELLAKRPWYQRDRVKIHGWEITAASHSKAVERLREFAPNVTILHQGVSAENGIMVVRGGGETASLSSTTTCHQHGHAHDAKREGDGSKDACTTLDANATTIEVVTWAHFVHAHSIGEVDFALIDVEGHEPSVLLGMNLDHSPQRFPIFQYEIGSTWVSASSAGGWSEADAALYLESHGYRLYLLGSKPAVKWAPGAYGQGDWTKAGYKSMLLPIASAHFREAAASKCMPFSKSAADGNGMQGNVLAVHTSALSRRPWLEPFLNRHSISFEGGNSCTAYPCGGFGQLATNWSYPEDIRSKG